MDRWEGPLSRSARNPLAAPGRHLAASIWAGHADLRSMAEVYLFAVLVLLGSRRGPGRLAVCAGAAAVVAAAHQALFL